MRKHIARLMLIPLFLNSISLESADLEKSEKNKVLDKAASSELDTTGSATTNPVNIPFQISTKGSQLTQTVILSTPQKNSIFSQPVIFIANVFPVHLSSVVPKGFVQFEVNNVPVAVIPLKDGTAKFKISTLSETSVNQHMITATYSGDDTYTSSKDGINYAVYPGNTNVFIQSRPNPSLFGRPVKLLVDVESVDPATVIPNGSVRVFVDEKKMGKVDLDNRGKAEFDLSDLPVGRHRIVASYFGSDNFYPKESEVIQEVAKSPSKAQISSLTNPSVYGQLLNFSVKITSDAGDPTGQVQIAVNGAEYGTPANIYNGEATFSIPDLEGGNHAIQAYYPGDQKFSSSQASLNQQVNKAPSHTEVISSINPVILGNVVYAAVKVASENLAPSGEVQFKLDGLNLSNPQTLGRNGQATIKLPELRPGEHKIDAEYFGNINFQSSTGSLKQVVNKAEAKISLISSANPVLLGKPVTLLAEVSAKRLVKGSVQFQIDGTPIGSPLTLNTKQQALLTLATGLKKGKQEIVAVYSGDDYHNSASSTPLIQEAIAAMVPPTDVQGHQIIHEGENEAQTLNIITWKAPKSETLPDAYRIYRDPALTQLLATFPANSDLQYIDVITEKKPSYAYYIVSVDSLGNQSSPSSVTIEQKQVQEKVQEKAKEKVQEREQPKENPTTSAEQ